MTIDRREFLGVAGASILAPLMGGDETIAPHLEATEPAPHDAEITDVRSVRRPSNDRTNSYTRVTARRSSGSTSSSCR